MACSNISPVFLTKAGDDAADVGFDFPNNALKIPIGD